jgi:hypothetical protein
LESSGCGAGNALGQWDLFMRTLKRYLARQLFRHIVSRRTFPIIKGKTACTLKEGVRDRLEFRKSICNAGLIRTPQGYVCVAKNQTFSYCDERGGRSPRRSPGSHTDDGIRALYRIDFDFDWNVCSIQRLSVVLNGELVDPVIFIEDVRLIVHGELLLAFANGNGAWPLLGTLERDVLTLKSAIASFSAPQKNWLPFEYGGRLYLEYSIEPHLILAADAGSAECKEAYRTQLPPGIVPSTLHGGAPPLRLNEDYFLGTGNSQHLYWFQERYYAAVFYLFDAKPPFRIVKASPPVRVQSRADRIQYICGLAFAPDKKSVVVSMGVSDCDNYMVQISLKHILALMKDVPATSSEHGS